MNDRQAVTQHHRRRGYRDSNVQFVKKKKKNVDKCMPAHRKYKKRSSKYRCEWQADCEWISLSVGLNTRQPAQFTMEDFLSVACGGLF